MGLESLCYFGTQKNDRAVLFPQLPGFTVLSCSIITVLFSGRYILFVSYYCTGYDYKMHYLRPL